MEQKPNKEQALCAAAADLFCRHGWNRVSIEEICAAAGVSRVTFYKYFANKKALLRHLIWTHKEDIRTRLDQAADHAESLQAVVTLFFQLQRQSLVGLYSPPMLADMRANRDEELQAFFRQLESGKQAFMADFFSRLQARHLIRSGLPPELIGAFIRQIDVLVADGAVQTAYAAQPQRLFEDVLRLLLNGLADDQTDGSSV